MTVLEDGLTLVTLADTFGQSLLRIWRVKDRQKLAGPRSLKRAHVGIN